jgi:hypothetical protein
VIIMRRLFIGLLLMASASLVAAQKALQQVDFRNVTYPWSYSSGWPSHLEWMDTGDRKQIQLTNGRWRLDTKAGEAYKPFSGLTLEDVRFDDVTGERQTDAVVTLRFDTGGTQYSHYVYIYSFAAGRPKLLAYFHSGDRAASGLYRVYGQDGKLVVELFDPEKASGDCCSSGFVRTRYRWHDGKFGAVGAREFGAPDTPSRLRVTMFGTHD